MLRSQRGFKRQFWIYCQWLDESCTDESEIEWQGSGSRSTVVLLQIIDLFERSDLRTILWWSRFVTVSREKIVPLGIHVFGYSRGSIVEITLEFATNMSSLEKSFSYSDNSLLQLFCLFAGRNALNFKIFNSFVSVAGKFGLEMCLQTQHQLIFFFFQKIGFQNCESGRRNYNYPDHRLSMILSLQGFLAYLSLQ